MGEIPLNMYTMKSFKFNQDLMLNLYLSWLLCLIMAEFNSNFGLLVGFWVTNCSNNNINFLFLLTEKFQYTFVVNIFNIPFYPIMI